MPKNVQYKSRKLRFETPFISFRELSTQFKFLIFFCFVKNTVVYKIKISISFVISSLIYFKQFWCVEMREYNAPTLIGKRYNDIWAIGEVGPQRGPKSLNSLTDCCDLCDRLVIRIVIFTCGRKFHVSNVLNRFFPLIIIIRIVEFFVLFCFIRFCFIFYFQQFQTFNST